MVSGAETEITVHGKLGLDGVARSGGEEPARVEAKRSNGKGGRPKPGMCVQPGLERGRRRRAAKACDGDVRGELPSLGRESRIRERAPHPARKRAEDGSGRGSGPEHSERPPGREMSQTAQGDAERGSLYRRQWVNDSAKSRSLDFSDERKGQMEPFRAHPARVRQSELHLGDALLQGIGQIESYEEAHRSSNPKRVRDGTGDAACARVDLRSDDGWAG